MENYHKFWEIYLIFISIDSSNPLLAAIRKGVQLKAASPSDLPPLPPTSSGPDLLSTLSNAMKQRRVDLKDEEEEEDEDDDWDDEDWE